MRRWNAPRFAAQANRALSEASGSVSRRAFGAGVTTAAVFGFGIGVWGPSLLTDEADGPTKRLSRKRSTADQGHRHSLIRDTTREKLMDDFELGSPINHGGTATVWRATERATNRRVAVKMIDKALVDAPLVSVEVGAMERCAGEPNVAQLIAALDVADDASPAGEWCLVLEMADGGELMQWVQRHPRYTEKVAAQLIAQAASSLAQVHSHGVVHRDIKPENLMLTCKEADASLKLVDFGAAALLEQGRTTVDDKAGTWLYWAPEQALGQPHGTEVDLWSLGVVAFILLSGRHPFLTGTLSRDGVHVPTTATPELALDAIAKARYSFDAPEWHGISDGARDVVTKLLEPDPRQRLTAEQLLAHPWCQGRGAPERPLPWWTDTLSLYRRLSFWGSDITKRDPTSTIATREPSKA